MIASLVAALALVSANPNVIFEWTPPRDGVPDHYIVLYSQVGYESEILVTTEPSITLQPVPGREINVRVAACADGFCSDWSRISQTFSLNRSADLTGDDVVGAPDLYLLISEFGHQSGYDLTGDGVIGWPDFSNWQQRFGQCIGPAYLDGAPVEAYMACSLLTY